MPAKNVADIPQDAIVEVRTSYKGTEITIEAVDSDGNQYFLPDAERRLFGINVEVRTHPMSNVELWRVTNSEATDGYGPLAYDLAMELASANGRGGLMTGTGLTEDSKHVWDFYRDHRLDVTREKLAEDDPWIGPVIDPDFPFAWKKSLGLVTQLKEAKRIVYKTGHDDLIEKIEDKAAPELDEQLRRLLEDDDVVGG